jgi:hypothetical protein
MSTPAQNLIAAVEAACRKGSWHGPTLHAAVRGVDARAALWRPGKGRHNIWELAIHTAYWKFAARRKLLRDRQLKFPFPGSNWFPVTRGTEREWTATRRLLDAQHRLLITYLRDAAGEIVRDAARSRLVFGVALHDVYHAGQIVLLKKLAAGR